VVTFVQITERQRAEQAFVKRKRLLRSVIYESPNLIVMKDWKRRLLLTNGAQSRLHGIAHEALLGRRASEREVYGRRGGDGDGQQPAALSAMGCGQAQGFHFARPLSPAAIEKRRFRADRSKHISPDVASGSAMIVPRWTFSGEFPIEPIAQAIGD
jgi:hypothetical protein